MRVLGRALLVIALGSLAALAIHFALAGTRAGDDWFGGGVSGFSRSSAYRLPHA